MSTATQVAIAMPFIVGLMALVIDSGWAHVCTAELHIGADAASLAAASSLARGESPYYSANEVAKENVVAGEPIDLSPDDVIVGDWDGSTFTPNPEGDAVRVVARRLGLPNFLGAFFGRPTFDLGAESYATVHPDNTWPCMMFAENDFIMNGSGRVSGYDSMTGLPAPVSMCSNSKSVRMSGTYRLDGDFHPGVDGTLSVTGAAVMTGDSSPLTSPYTLSRSSMPGSGMSLPASIKTSASLSTGVYVRRGDLSIGAKGEVVITSGPVDIYIDGDVDINGSGFVNTTADPHQLTIHVIGSHTVNINGSSAFYGVIDAPDSDVKLNGTASFWGAVAASTIDHNGSGDVHLDQSLAEELDLDVPGSGWGCAILVR